MKLNRPTALVWPCYIKHGQDHSGYLLGSMAAHFVMQGLAKHSRQDVNSLLDEALTALSTVLADKRYLVADAPCEADAALFGVLDQVVNGKLASPELKSIVQQYPNLYLHTRRIRDNFFPDKDVSLTGRLVYDKACQVEASWPLLQRFSPVRRAWSSTT